VVSVAESRVVRVIATRWRADLPLVAPDGDVLVADSSDAVEVDPPTGAVRRRFPGGARDLWALIRWNGFRPRAKGLDQPVSFEADSTDSLGVVAPDSVAPRAVAVPGAPPVALPPTRDEPRPEVRPRPAGWTLSFAALLDERRARALAATIRVEGHPVRVVSSLREGITIWRVVSGPFTNRDDAERAGRRTGLPFWVYEESP
jgi:cell division septation protein DedD